LQGLITAGENMELECREYLQYAKELLVRDTVREYVYIETERRSSSGDSDYIISGKVVNESGYETVRVYIWELKAPQCPIFRKDTENRLIPSVDLFHAENQLFHYYHELQGSAKFMHDFGITHPDYIRIGGIIIGSKDTWISGQIEEPKRSILLENMMMIRKKYVYDPNHMRLLSWNQVLEHISGTTQLPAMPQEQIAEGIDMTRASDTEIRIDVSN
jgi:hypothetical protein